MLEILGGVRRYPHRPNYSCTLFWFLKLKHYFDFLMISFLFQPKDWNLQNPWGWTDYEEIEVRRSRRRGLIKLEADECFFRYWVQPKFRLRYAFTAKPLRKKPEDKLRLNKLGFCQKERVGWCFLFSYFGYLSYTPKRQQAQRLSMHPQRLKSWSLRNRLELARLLSSTGWSMLRPTERWRLPWILRAQSLRIFLVYHSLVFTFVQQLC